MAAQGFSPGGFHGVEMAETTKKPSSFDVARVARVSRTTVSYVLNERHDLAIPQATRERVFRAAAELGYRQNHLARSLRSGKTMLLGVILPGLDEPYMAAIVHGIEAACAEEGYRVLLANSQRDPATEARQVGLLLEHRIDGLICLPSEHTLPWMTSWLETVQENGTACVVVDDRSLSDRLDCVISDDLRGARLAVEHLIRRGHRCIAHLAGSQNVSSGQDRRNGYAAALEDAGIAVDPDMICVYSFDADRVAPAVEPLLSRPDPPTALFAANDVMAAEARETLRTHGRRVPDDMALVGYGNMSWGRYLGLTTVDQDDQVLGREAARRLFARLRDRQSSPEQIVLPTRLIVRETCGSLHPVS